MLYGYNRNPKYDHAGVEGEYLPFIPPPRWLSDISYIIPTGGGAIPAITLKEENDLNFAQNRYLGLNLTETPTAAYDLVNFSVNGDVHIVKGISCNV